MVDFVVSAAKLQVAKSTLSQSSEWGLNGLTGVTGHNWTICPSCISSSPAKLMLVAAGQGPNYQVEDAGPLVLARPVHHPSAMFYQPKALQGGLQRLARDAFL